MTTRWFTAVLRSAQAISASAVTIIHFEPVGVSVMGALTRATLTYDNPEPGAPPAVIVNVASRHQANRAQAVALGVHEAEARFFNELATTTSARVPRCYLAEVDPATSDFVIVIEDVGCQALSAA